VFRATLALDFMAFTEFAFGVVRPNTQFKPNWHLEALAHKLSQVAAGEVKRLIVTMPPRNLKSLFASVALPVAHKDAPRWCLMFLGGPRRLGRAWSSRCRGRA